MMYIQRPLSCDYTNSNYNLLIPVISNTSVKRRSNEDKISSQSELILYENMYESAVNCVLLI